MKKTLRMLLPVSLLAAGCNLAPTYPQPDTPVPDAWPTGAAYNRDAAATERSALTELGWREFVTDDHLRQVIATALENNRDLRLAALNVQRARALYGIRRRELYPTLYVAGNGGEQRASADLTSAGQPRRSERYSVDLGVFAWELDFFGRLRNLKDDALETYLATEQARRSAHILVVSAVANAYLALAADRDALALAKDTFETQKDAYDLVRRRYEAGVATELDLRRAQIPVETARADIARYTRQLAQAENALRFLVGSTVSPDLLPSGLQGVTPSADVAPSLPSDMLLNRPDIIAAEHRLKAAYARIGAARAAFFPRISLTTTLGTASDDLTGLFGAGTDTWSYAPEIVMPVFDARTWAAYRVSNAERDIAVATYERAIQNAFREVADALAVEGTISQQLAAHEAQVNALAHTYGLARARFDKGIDSYLGVLDAQRAFFAARQGLISLRLAERSNKVALYAVLGGGWRPTAVPEASATAPGAPHEEPLLPSREP